MPVAQPPTPAAPAAATDRASLLVLGMAAFMVQADARVIDPLLHVIASDFNTTPPSAAVVISSYALPYGLFQLLYGPIGDRVGKIRVMAAAWRSFRSARSPVRSCRTFPVFATLRFLTGVAAAAVIPMSLGYIGDKFAYQDRQIALARFMSALMIGQIVGSTLGGVFGEYLGWRYIFVVFGVVSLAVSALLLRRPGVRGAPQHVALAGPAILTVPLGASLIFVGLLRCAADGVVDRLQAAGAACWSTRWRRSTAA